MNNLNGIQRFLMAAVMVLLIVAFVPQFSMYAYAAVFFFFLFGIRFFFELSNGVPLKALIIIIAVLQWLIGPVLAYYFYPDSEFYYMYIEEQQYMGFVVPAMVAFAAGLFVFSGKENKTAKESLASIFNNPGEYYVKGYLLIIVGFAATAALKLGFVPASLRYFTLLVSYFKIIGAFYVFASGSRFRWIWILAAFGIEVVTAFGNAMFHDMILWAGYLFILYTFIDNSKIWKKLAILSSMAIAVFLIQSIKKDYRAEVWEDQKGIGDTEKIGLAVDIAQKETDQFENLLEEENMQQLVDRINQGWIIARIMYMVPKFEPYAEGETINKGLKAALLPRILAPEKVKSGGHENFSRFTGIIIDQDTSMDLSVLGEAYANYGYNGAIFFMFLLGLFYNMAYKIIVNQSKKRPEILFWIPFVFFYSVKAENDFATAFNQFVKSVLVLVAVLWGMKLVFKKEQSGLKASEGKA